MSIKTLVINPGSTSTKVGVFEDETLLFEETLRHPTEEIAKYPSVIAQKDFRKEIILDFLKEKNCDPKSLNVIVGRGGLLKPIPGGTYAVSDALLADLEKGVQGQHASNLGGILAREIGDKLGVPSYIVDPVVVDELTDKARLSGMPELPRRSIFHALNQKAVARRFAKEHGTRYEDLNLIVIHMGGGVSVGAHDHGKVVDVNNILDGEGCFSPERSGTVPVGDLVKMCFSGKYTQQEVYKKICGNGGFNAYLHTNDARTVDKMALEGNAEAKLVQDAFYYQIAKDAGAMAAVLCGKVDQIILTGGIAYNPRTRVILEKYLGFIAPITVYPGEDELLALCQGALRVVNGEEQAKEYCSPRVCGPLCKKQERQMPFLLFCWSVRGVQQFLLDGVVFLQILGRHHVVDDIDRHRDDRAFHRFLIGLVVQIHKGVARHHGGAGIGGIGVAVHEAPVVAGYVQQRAVGDHVGVDGHRAVGQPAAAGPLGRAGRRIPGGTLAGVGFDHALGGDAVHDLRPDKTGHRRLFAVHLDDVGHHAHLGHAVHFLGPGPLAVQVDFAPGDGIQAVAALLQNHRFLRAAVEQAGGDLFQFGRDHDILGIFFVFHPLQGQRLPFRHHGVGGDAQAVVAVVADAKLRQQFPGRGPGADDLPGLAVGRHVHRIGAQYLQRFAVGAWGAHHLIILPQRRGAALAQQRVHVGGRRQDAGAAAVGIADHHKMQRLMGKGDGQRQCRGAPRQRAPLGQRQRKAAADMFFCLCFEHRFPVLRRAGSYRVPGSWPAGRVRVRGGRPAAQDRRLLYTTPARM